MYKCCVCGNTEYFEEIDTGETDLKNAKNISDEIVECSEVCCLDCGAKYSDGNIAHIESELSPLNTKIMTEITEYCVHECGDCNNCSEDMCVLYRIENLIMANDEI